MNFLTRLLLLALLVGSFPAFAQAQNKNFSLKPADPLQQIVDKAKADFTAKTGVKATGDVPFDLLRALDAKLLPDLQYALKLATATNNNITAVCYQAWIDVITVQQTAVQTGTPPTDIPIPDPHIITDFERAVELRNMLQPDSKFMTSCSPVANLIKQDVINFMGKVIGGGTSLMTLIPGL